MAEPNWSQWASFTERGEEIPQTSGTYEIRWATNGQPKAIPRFNGIDQTGLMYIGETDNLNRRIRRFYRCVSINPEGRNVRNFHGGAVTFVVFGFNRMVNPQELQFRYAEMDENQRHVWEARLLSEYMMTYLDKPPLNTAIKR
jgi:hypothetical protein